MRNLLKTMDGYKTYLVAAYLVVVSLLRVYGVVDVQAYQLLLGLAGAGGVAAFRSALKKLEN